MKTIYVTGGDKDYAVLTLTDSLGHDLSTATIVMGLSASQTTQPTTWRAPDVAVFPAAGQAVVSLLIDSTRAPVGTYYVWSHIADSPTLQPVVARNSQLKTV